MHPAAPPGAPHTASPAPAAPLNALPAPAPPQHVGPSLPGVVSSVVSSQASSSQANSYLVAGDPHTLGRVLPTAPDEEEVHALLSQVPFQLEVAAGAPDMVNADERFIPGSELLEDGRLKTVARRVEVPLSQLKWDSMMTMGQRRPLDADLVNDLQMKLHKGKLGAFIDCCLVECPLGIPLPMALTNVRVPPVSS